MTFVKEIGKMSNKKRVYRSKPPVRKKKPAQQSSIKSVLSACLLLVIGGGLCFVGYSVVVPVFEYFSNQSNESVIDSQKDSGSDSKSKDSSSVDSKNDDDSTPDTTTVSDNSVTTSDSSEGDVTSASTTAPPVSQPSAAGYYLSAKALESVSALETELAGLVNSSSTYSSVIVPLKQEGGGLMYASKIRLAQLASVVDSKVTLGDIVGAITKLGLESVAQINLLDDNRYPLVQKKSAYQFADGITGSWLDAAKEDGGKPWMSPFSDITKNYMTALSEEISGAGFKKIICSGVHFPNFKEKDLGYIGELVVSAERYKGLTGIVNTVGNNAVSGATVMLEVSAKEAVDGTCEVLKPSELSGITIVPVINFDKFEGTSPASKVESVMVQLKNVCGGLNIIPCIDDSSVNDNQLKEVISRLAELGYKSYFIV